MREHHLVPQEMLRNPGFVNHLRNNGIMDPKDFIDRQIAHLANEEHVRIHKSDYNAEWRSWFNKNRNFTQEELQQEIRNAMNRHNIPKASRTGRKYGCG